MSERLEVLKIDIGECTVYDWECPACGASNDIYGEEPSDGDEIQCESCSEISVVIDD